MKTVVAALYPPTGEGRTPRTATASTAWLTMKPVQEPDAANRHIGFNFITSIWCGATVGASVRQ